MPDFGKILSLLNKREKRKLVFVVFILLIMGFIELVGVGSIGPFVSIISNPTMIHTNPYLQKAFDFFHFFSDINFIITFGIAVAVMLAVSNVCLAFINYLLYSYTGKRNYSISMRLFEKYLHQPYIFFLNTNTADLSNNILNEAATLVNGVLLNFLNLISSGVISLSIIALLFMVQPILALVISVVFSLAYILIFYTVRKFLDRKGKERYMLNMLKHKYVNETFGGIKDVKILGKEKVSLNLFKDPTRRVARNNAISETVGDVPKFLLETIAFTGIIGVIVVLMKGGAKIDEFLPSLTIYAFGAYRLMPGLQKMYRCFTNLRYYRAIIDKFYNILVELPEGTEFSADDTPRLPFKKNIRLENIIFSYPGSEREVIKGQSLVIEANTSIALVGATGCGKTTLIDVILGLLEAQNGKILIDGVEITDENRRMWQKNLGYVPQSIYLTDDTIRNNIAFGIDPQKIDDEAVENAAKTASIHDFIVTELPLGYNTVIGERGVRLSGGQRQRIGIARAVYHNPSVLILDEATSALDGLTEMAIMDAIKTLGHKKTIIMIAHRITTVKGCDIIYMMDKGVVTDSGNYEELYEKNEIFRKMADGS
ncbi:MAG: ABC transporter ATP-binding protein/permease [Treponema sp.]|jgi:ABC-type multidrug transport system fused ATPase/permease subunit|nr:ABC transporter ATP-binding protein/permease [Treponema sp.]